MVKYDFLWCHCYENANALQEDGMSREKWIGPREWLVGWATCKSKLTGKILNHDENEVRKMCTLITFEFNYVNKCIYTLNMAKC